jgi:hypothetical protein
MCADDKEVEKDMRVSACCHFNAPLHSPRHTAVDEFSLTMLFKNQCFAIGDFRPAR